VPRLARGAGFPSRKKAPGSGTSHHDDLSWSLHLAPNLIPLDGYGLVVARELVSGEPQLESQVGRRHDDADLELADVEQMAAGPA